jgi:hypothetical protein
MLPNFKSEHFKPTENIDKVLPETLLGFASFTHILGSPSSYMTLQLIPSQFPYIWGKFRFLFFPCMIISVPHFPVVVSLLWTASSVDISSHGTRAHVERDHQVKHLQNARLTVV